MNNVIKPIGSFLEFELPHIGKPYHERALALSTGRACLNYIIQQLHPTKLFIPFYTCDSVVDPIEANQLPFEFYAIDSDLEPVITQTLHEGEYFLYINYFGIKSQTVNQLLEVYGNQLIIDNTHAFFEKGYPNNWSFTSARKYFGVPDGAYLYAPLGFSATMQLPRFEKIAVNYLFNRAFGDREQAYSEYLEYEENLNCELTAISTFSEKLLNTVDYDWVIAKRMENFQWLHQHLKGYNQLKINNSEETVPFRYPFLPPKPLQKQAFHAEQLYVTSFWSDTLHRGVEGFDYEQFISQHLLPLPIDHRYDTNDLDRLATFIIKQLS